MTIRNKIFPYISLSIYYAYFILNIFHFKYSILTHQEQDQSLLCQKSANIFSSEYYEHLT